MHTDPLEPTPTTVVWIGSSKDDISELSTEVRLVFGQALYLAQGEVVKAKTRKKNDNTIIEGSGNVFADMGVAEPEQALAKARLAAKMFFVIRDRYDVSRPLRVQTTVTPNLRNEWDPWEFGNTLVLRRLLESQAIRHRRVDFEL